MVRLVKLASVGLAGMLSTCAAAAMDERSENVQQVPYSVFQENVKEELASPLRGLVRERIENNYSRM